MHIPPTATLFGLVDVEYVLAKVAILSAEPEALTLSRTRKGTEQNGVLEILTVEAATNRSDLFDLVQLVEVNLPLVGAKTVLSFELPGTTFDVLGEHPLAVVQSRVNVGHHFVDGFILTSLLLHLKDHVVPDVRLVDVRNRKPWAVDPVGEPFGGRLDVRA